jgi:lipid A ethanolaminephosphotransferase
MFSALGAENYDGDKARTTENALDVLHVAGVNVLWRDNNSSSKNVSDRLPTEDFRTPSTNTICDDECRDVGMLVGLQDYINSHPEGDILIVLHQMGNHGPAYYKRYPKSFEKFTPACQTNELSECSIEEIGNAYDNAILYTDYFLSKVIALLKQNDDKFETVMMYASDHGESLGENGMYLHGMPNFVAPKAQRQVPMIFWLGANYDDVPFEALAAKRDMPLNHDIIFHSLLSVMEVESAVYNKELDILHSNGVK